ncbi:MAG: agmatinase [Alphaproteobacteria bacterium]|nr:agmatinase [Alphaproteobacteria bacterium]
MLNNNAFLWVNKTYEESSDVLFGAPFDSTSSFRPGSRFASKHMRIDSGGIELYSPYLDKSFEEDASVHDAGDLDLPVGDVETTLQQIEEYTAQLLKDKKRPVMVGGEHLVSLGVIRALAKKYPDLHIIHFDAHTDLREELFGCQLSHATVIRRAWDILGDKRIYQFGIRSGDKKEFVWAGAGHVHLQKFNFDGLENAVQKLKDKPVYFTLDLDVLDPSVFPGTGTPEPGGVSFQELQNAINTISGLNNIVGFDMVELSPHYDQSGVSTATAIKLLREMFLAFSKE